MTRTRLASVATVAAAAAALVAVPVAAKSGPDVIPLPNAYEPEGIASGPGNNLYVGSIEAGRVVRVDAKRGTVTDVVPDRDRSAIGLKVDRGRIFVAGGQDGRAYVYDARTGADIANVALAATPTFINDVVVTKRAAYFTDSQRQQLYRLPLGPGGEPASSAQTLPITGDLQYDSDPRTFEANGIVASPDGKTLIVVQSGTGRLFRVDPATGVSTELPVANKDENGLLAGDGLLLSGKTLYVVQNRFNRITVVALGSDLASGRVARSITDKDFDIPTTVARKGSDLFAVNARFGTEVTPDTEYDVVRVPAVKRRR